MKKNIIVFGIGMILLIIGISQIMQYNQNYHNKEKIIATIYQIDTKRKEYKSYDENVHHEVTKYYKVYDVYYEYEYKGKKKAETIHYHKWFWKENSKIAIYYDENTDSSIPYTVPYIWCYVAFLGIAWCFISIVSYLQKYNLVAPIPITIIHIMLPIFVFICYWYFYIENEGQADFGYVGMMWFFIFFHVVIFGGTICQILVKDKKEV